MKIVTLVLCGWLLVCGCAGPVQEALWRPLPTSITLTQPLAFHARGVGDVTLPSGEYRYWYQNKLGYFYANDDQAIQFKEDRLVGAAHVRSFKGGIWLSNRAPQVLVYELSTVAEQSKKTGEIAHLAAMEAGDKDGRYRVFRGVVPKEVVEKIGIKP
jgi:hypothetical protein